MHVAYKEGVHDKRQTELCCWVVCVRFQRVRLLASRELKRRSARRPDELTFQIHQYVEAEEPKLSCCSYF